MKEQTSYNDKRKKAIIILIILLLLLAFLGSFFFIRGRLNASAAEQAGIAEENGNNEAQNNEVSSTTNTENNTVTNTTETLQAVTTNTRRENNGSTNANSGTNNGNDNENDNSNNNQNTNNSNNNPSNDNQNGNEEPADTTAPEITGIEDGKVYAENVTATINADDLEKAICKFVAEDGTESEYEFSSGKEFTESGKYILIVTDKSGNKTEISFTIDKNAPEITGVENGKIYNVDVTPVISDKNLKKVTYKLNDGEENDLEEGTTLVEEGIYTITAEDEAGNKVEISFEIDKTAPVYTNLGIIRNKTQNDTRDTSYAKDGDSVRVLVAFAEKLAVEPTVKVGDKEYVATYRPLSSNEAENVFYYMADIDVTEEIPEGKIEFSIEGYADVAGNVGTTLSNTDINMDYASVTVDRTAPVLTVKDESVGTDPYYSKISFKLYDNNAVVKYILNGTERTCTPNNYSDANYGNINNLLVEGENTITLVDIAGNETTRTFIYDITSPTAVVTYSNDNGNAMTNQDVTVTLTASEDIKDIEGWTKVDSKTFTKVYGENGKHSVEIEDKAGNKTTINYEVKRIDKVAPVIDLSNTKSTFEVGVDVYTYPENITIYDESDKAISVSKLNIQWFKANADGSKGEPVANFEWNTTLKNRELGDYYIYYYIRDKAGNLAETHRIVTLQDTTKPEIIINGNSEEHISLGSEYTDAGFTVSDNRDEASQINTVTKITWYSLTGDSSEVGQVNKDIEGRYNIDYIATDRAGNKQKVTRLVYVEDNTTLDFDGISYDTSVNGEVTVTITANKKIKLNSGWEYTDSSKKAMYRVYTENTEYLGEDITVSDLKGATKVANILVTSIVTNGTRNVNVTSKAGFDKLVVDMRSGVTFKNAVINIDTDIDLSNENWTSIYAGQNNNIFSNTIIDGKEHKITGMKVSRNPATNDGRSEATQYGIGFIGDLNGSLTIKNLTFDGAQVIDANGGTGSNYSQHYAGVVVGHTDAKLKLENVNVSNSKVLNSWQCGGLVGFSGEDITFDNCSVSNTFVGGTNATSGALFGMGSVNVNINNCKANKVKLYSDGLTWDSVQKIDSIYWIGDNYKYHSHSGKTISIDADSTITDVSIVDTLE